MALSEEKGTTSGKMASVTRIKDVTAAIGELSQTDAMRFIIISPQAEQTSDQIVEFMGSNGEAYSAATATLKELYTPLRSIEGSTSLWVSNAIDAEEAVRDLPKFVAGLMDVTGSSSQAAARRIMEHMSDTEKAGVTANRAPVSQRDGCELAGT